MAGNELVPYGQGERGLQPGVRRVLTNAGLSNPVRHETGSLISLAPDEAAQIVRLANGAATAIDAVGELLIAPAAETRTMLNETRQGTSTETQKSVTSTGEQTKIRGFFTISVDTEGQMSTRGEATSKTTEQRSGTSVASLRQGQFLTGEQVRDALERLATARGEGLLLLPTASSELDRRQNSMLAATRRVITDHGEANPSWAEDIQGGTVSGLIEQLQQTMIALLEGYVAIDLDGEFSSYAHQTIQEELMENLESSFRHLIQFSLIPTDRRALAENTALALQSSILNLFPINPQASIRLLEVWRDTFSQEAQTDSANSAGIIGRSFARTLCACLLQTPDTSDNNGTFVQLAGIIQKTTEGGGAQLILHAFIDEAKQQAPLPEAVLLFSEVAQTLSPETAGEDTLIALVRFSLAAEVLGAVSSDPTSLLERLAERDGTYRTRLRIITGDLTFSWNTLTKLINGLTVEEREQIKFLLRQSDKSWEIDWLSSSYYSREVPFPGSIETMEDVEFIQMARDYFEQQLQTAIVGAKKYPDPSLIDDHVYMYSQCSPAVQERLRRKYNEQFDSVFQKASGFFHEHAAEIMALSSSRTLAQATGLKDVSSDREMHDFIRDIQNGAFSGQSLKRQIQRLGVALYQVEAYLFAINYVVGFTLNPFERRHRQNLRYILHNLSLGSLTNEYQYLADLRKIFFQNDN